MESDTNQNLLKEEISLTNQVNKSSINHPQHQKHNEQLDNEEEKKEETKENPQDSPHGSGQNSFEAEEENPRYRDLPDGDRALYDQRREENSDHDEEEESQSDERDPGWRERDADDLRAPARRGRDNDDLRVPAREESSDHDEEEESQSEEELNSPRVVPNEAPKELKAETFERKIEADLPKNKIPIDVKKEVQKKKKQKRIIRESYIDLKEVLPEGIRSASQLRGLYEEKRNIKKNMHLNLIQGAHQDRIFSVIFSKDEKFVISGSADHSIKIYNAETKEQVHHIKDVHSGILFKELTIILYLLLIDAISCLAITSDNKFLISGSWDRSIKIFDLETRKQIHHFENIHNDRISAIAITHDDKYLISGSWDASIKIFDMKTKQEIHHFKNANQDKVKCLAVTRDNTFLISGSSDLSIKVFDIEKKKDVHTFKNIHDGDILSVAVPPAKTHWDIISASADGSVKVLSISTGNEVYHFEGIHDRIKENKSSNKIIIEEICSVAITADNNYFITGSADSSIKMFDLHTKKQIHHFKNLHADDIYSVAINSNNKRVISGSADKALGIFNIEKQEGYIAIKKAHDGMVSSLIISPNSKYLISGGDDRSIRIFKIKTQKSIHDFDEIHNDKVSSLAMSSNSRYLISSSWDRSIKIFTFQNKQLYHHFTDVHVEVIRAIAITPDNKYIVSVSDDKSIKLLDIENKTEAHHFSNAHKAEIYAVTVTPDNKYIVSGSGDKSIKMFDIATRKEFYHFEKAHDDEVFAVAVTPNNKYVLSGSRDFSLKIFDLETKQPIHTFDYAHNNSIFTLSVSSDSRLVAGGSADQSVRIFDIETKQRVHILENAHEDWVWAVGFTPNNKYIVSGAGDGSLKLFGLKTGLKSEEIQNVNQGDACTSVVVTPDNQYIICARGDYRICILGTQNKDVKFTFADCHGGMIKTLAVSPDGRFLISGSADQHIKVWSLKEWKQVHKFKDAHKDVVSSVTVTPDSRFIVSCSKDKSIKIFDLEKLEEVYHFKNIHEGAIRSVTVTPDNQFIISGSIDRVIKILNIETKQEVFEFKEAHQRWIKSVKVTPDGQSIVSCSDDRSIRIFDLQTKQLVHCFKNAHNDFIESIVISKDGRFIVSASRDRSIKIFDIQTKRQVHHFPNIHKDRIKSITITPDNKWIVSGSNDMTVKLHRMISISTENPQIDSLISPETEICYVYDGSMKYSNFNGVDAFLFNPTLFTQESVKQFAQRSQDLVVYPFTWNILHIAASQANYPFIKYLPDYSEFKTPFLLDHFSKTPLHYLLAQEKIHYDAVNKMLAYTCDYLEDQLQENMFQVQQILKSFTPLFGFILTKTDLKIRSRFLEICFINPPTPYGKKILSFGEDINEGETGQFYESLDRIYPVLEDNSQEGDQQIDYRMTMFNMDYSILSRDMQKLIKCLLEQKDSGIFKTSLIKAHIDYLWGQSSKALGIFFIAFSAFLAMLYFYISNKETYWAFDMVVFYFSSVFLFAEIQQIRNIGGENYFKGFWNLLNMTHLFLTKILIFTRFFNMSSEYTQTWISNIVLMSGFLRWISYLRIFKPTRNLIQFKILNEIKSFMVFLGLIIGAFSLISPTTTMTSGVHSLENKTESSSWFFTKPGEIEALTGNSSNQTFTYLMMILLGIFSLKWLVLIIGGDSRSSNRKIKEESLVRLELIQEGAILLKWMRRQRVAKKGYLVFCLGKKGEEEQENEGDWEEKVEVLKKMVKESEVENGKTVKTLKEDIQKQVEKSQNIQGEKLERKTNEILELLKHINDKKED